MRHLSEKKLDINYTQFTAILILPTFYDIMCTDIFGGFVMYKLCKSEQSANRRRELEQQLLTMMETLRLDEITVSDLCVRAGISRKVFYRYFSGKEGALYALIDHTLLELENVPYAGKLHGEHGYQKKLAWFFRFWQEQKRLLDAIAFSGISQILVERVIEYALSDAGAIRDFLPCCGADAREYATTFSACGFMSTVLLWHRSDFQMSPDQMAEVVMPLLTKPLIQLKTT